MGKTLKKIILTMVFLTLAVALVYGADLLSNSKSKKIELINGTYYAYNLEKVYTNKSIEREINELNKEKENLQELINNLEEDCSYCVYEKTKDCEADCLKDGSWTTESEEIYFNQTIKKLEEKIWYLENLI